MPEYHFYRTKRADHIGAPPQAFKLPNDIAAVEHAKKMLDGHGIEVWRGQLIIAQLDPKD